jgi:LysR family glycine cleavage system transcriptional activator
MNTSNRLTSLRGLRTFCIAAECASFRDAAERLYITASAVSHQIKSLEEEFGTKLFEKSGRSLRLTAAGQALYEDVSPLISELDATTTRHKRSRPRSTLHISVQPFFASELFVPRLPDFTRSYPDIEIKVDTSDESSEKHPAASDVSIRVFRSAPRDLAAERLFSLRLIPAASAEFQKAIRVKGKQISSDFPMIIHDSRPHAWSDWQKKSGMRVPGDSKTVQLDSMIAIARAAERGLGAALVPSQLSDSWFDSGALVRLFPDELETDDAYYFAYRHDDHDNQNVQQLRSWALSQFRNL